MAKQTGELYQQGNRQKRLFQILEISYKHRIKANHLSWYFSGHDYFKKRKKDGENAKDSKDLGLNQK